MRVLDYLHKETILPDLKAVNKKGVIDELALPAANISGMDHATIAEALMERERLGSTGIGGGVGIPHGKLPGLEQLVAGFGLSRRGVNFDAVDGKPVHLFFLLLSPDDTTGLHLMLLARISKLLKSHRFKTDLANAPDAEAVIRIVSEADNTN